MQRYHLENLDCANCAARIEEAVQTTPGVRFASVDFATTTLFLEADDLLPVQKSIQRVEPEVSMVAKRDIAVQVASAEEIGLHL